MNAEIVWRPQPRQAEFMRRPEPEALYGGAAGGGKSDALVIEALRQVHIPHYRGLILRKTYPQLSDLVDKSMAYYKRAFPTAQYNATSHVWVFPSGAKIYFGSMQYTKDRTNYQGKAFDFIGFDELTHFEWDEYSYMMSRNRPTGPGTRVYLRATTNPGGVGHGWVKARFITPAPPGTPIVEQFPVRMPDGTEKVLERARVFIPSSNPSAASVKLLRPVPALRIVKPDSLQRNSALGNRFVHRGAHQKQLPLRNPDLIHIPRLHRKFRRRDLPLGIPSQKQQEFLSPFLHNAIHKTHRTVGGVKNLISPRPGQTEYMSETPA